MSGEKFSFEANLHIKPSMQTAKPPIGFKGATFSLSDSLPPITQIKASEIQPAPYESTGSDQISFSLANPESGLKVDIQKASLKPPSDIINAVLFHPEMGKIGSTNPSEQSTDSLSIRINLDHNSSSVQIEVLTGKDSKADPQIHISSVSDRFSSDLFMPALYRPGGFTPPNEIYLRKRVDELSLITPAVLPSGLSPFRPFLGRLAERYYKEFNLDNPMMMASYLEAILFNETHNEERFIPKEIGEKTLQQGDRGHANHAWQLDSRYHADVNKPMTFEESGVYAIEEVLLPYFKRAQRFGIENPWIAAARGYNGGEAGLQNDASTTNFYGARTLERWLHYGGSEVRDFLSAQGLSLSNIA
ncbi:MAG: hypothetical protein SFT81_00870 [Candidatus Caenarcaniphilales bacterium]|nr:hypothetical protein [Candidatus Caenarcaniphilales bacterium]